MGMELVSFELINKIREHIERTEKHAALLNDLQKFYRVASSLDVLEDTSYAVEYYVDSEYPDDIKGRYLYIYGLMQALFVQLDAANGISVALLNEEINFKEKYPKAFSFREARNDVTGHPTLRGRNNFVYLTQMELFKGSFSYFKENSETEESKYITIDVEEVINDVSSCVNDILQKTIDDLEKEFKEFIELHRDRKMKEIFELLTYAEEKALSDEHLTEWGYNATKDMVKKCKEEVVKRYGTIKTIDAFNYLFKDVDELYALLDEAILQIPNDYRSRIKRYLIEILFVKLGELEHQCEVIDAYFENYGDEPTFSEEEKCEIKIEFV